MTEIQDAIPAATIIPMRDGRGGLEILMLRRGADLKSFGGAWVFPGGKVDPDDHADADPFGESAARRAAVREAEEEAGLRVTVDELVPFSHWTPPPIPGRRFATWFFFADIDEDDIITDGSEVHEHRWETPTTLLADRAAGAINLAPPTFVTLNHLMEFADVAAALNHGRPVERYETRRARGADALTLLWHGDAGYADMSVVDDGPRHRLIAGDEWVYERTIVGGE